MIYCITMKKKPIIIITTILLLAVCAFIFIQSKYLAKPEKNDTTEIKTNS
jgi:hypothetical protein